LKRLALAVPLALLLLPATTLLLAPADMRVQAAGCGSYLLSLVLWLLTRRLAAHALVALAAGAGIGLLFAAFFLPFAWTVAASPANRALFALLLAFAGLILGGALGLEKATASAAAVAAGANGGAAAPATPGAAPKLCDTSVLIDGRIADMAAAGFFEGELIIPQFVLHELQGIADSSEQLKRNRGRRGLDIVKYLQETKGLTVRITSSDYRDESEVDHKLIRLADEIGAVLITNDFNLNKVARVRNIKVFNLNDLVNALKTIYLPGEEIIVTITREGKESGQGVGYLNDGTMVVVDGAAAHVAQEVRAVVTNIHQTTAGRMIFARCEGAVGKRDHRNEKQG